MKKSITVLVVEPKKTPYLKEIIPELNVLQNEVGGYIQVVYPWKEPVALICDDDAKLKGKELNRALRDEEGQIYDVVAGTFLLVGISEDDFTSLDSDLVHQFTKMFELPEIFIRAEDKIMVIPMIEQ